MESVQSCHGVEVVVHVCVSKDCDCGENEPMNEREEEVFHAVNNIIDPEKKATLYQLGILRKAFIRADKRRILVAIKPTLPSCGEVKTIGLCVWKRILDQVTESDSCRVCVSVLPHTHLQWEDINKQLADKERVLAALENAEIQAVLGPLCDS